MQANFHKTNVIRIHLSLLVLALTILYWQSFAYWVNTWLTNFDYRPGFIMPLLSFYMVWKKRAWLASSPIKPSKSGLLLISVAILLYVGGQAAYVKVAQQLSFFVILPGIILYYFGFQVLRRLSIPLLILVFMTPYAELFYSHLQFFVAQACGEIMRFFGAPVYVESHCIHLPNIRVEVAAGCTGIRYMTAILPVGLTIAWIHMDSRWKKVSMAVFSLILAIVANLFRIVTMLTYALKGNETLVSGPHKTYGYVVFLGALFILFGFSLLLERFRKKPFPKQQEMVTRLTPYGSWTKGFSSYRNLVLIALVLMIPALVHARLLTQSMMPLAQGFESFPLILEEWRGRELGEDEWHPQIVGETDDLRRIYKDADGNEIRVFVSYLPIQTQDQELVHHANRILPPEFRIIAQDLKTWTINVNPSSLKLKTKAYVPIDEAQNLRLFCWYQNTDRYLHSEYMAKAFMALDSLLKDRSNGSVFVLIFTSSSYNKNAHEVKIHNFLNSFFSEISKYIPS